MLRPPTEVTGLALFVTGDTIASPVPNKESGK